MQPTPRRQNTWAALAATDLLSLARKFDTIASDVSHLKRIDTVDCKTHRQLWVQTDTRSGGNIAWVDPRQSTNDVRKMPAPIFVGYAGTPAAKNVRR
jgi:hypothetical protein